MHPHTEAAVRRIVAEVITGYAKDPIKVVTVGGLTVGEILTLKEERDRARTELIGTKGEILALKADRDAAVKAADAADASARARGVNLLGMTEHAGAHLCRAEKAERARDYAQGAIDMLNAELAHANQALALSRDREASWKKGYDTKYFALEKLRSAIREIVKL